MNQPVQDLGTLRKGEVIGGLLYLPVFLLGTPFLAAFIVFIVTGSRNYEDTSGPMELVYTALNALFLGLILRHYLVDQFRRLRNRGWSIFGDLGMGFLIYFGAAMAAARAVAFLQALLQVEYHNANQEAVESIIAQSPLSAILSACLLAPIGEELIFRGIIFCGLRRKSQALAYLVSMFSFALVHLLSSMFHQPILSTLLALVVYLPHGLALAWTYERSGTICCSIFLHATMNMVSMLALSAMR